MKRVKIKNRRRRPGELANRGNAIRNFCLECVCYSPKEVKLCCSPKCWLYPYRFGVGGQAARIVAAEDPNSEGFSDAE